MGPIWIYAAVCLTLAATSVNGNRKIKPGTVLQVTSVLESPFLMIRNADSNVTLAGNDRYEGYIKSLLDEVAKTAGFDYEITLAPDNRYGNFENSTWNGMVGEIVDGRADIAASTLTVTAMRALYIDFSVPFMNSGPVLLMRKPSLYKASFLDRLREPLVPFSDMLWLTILISYLVTGFFLYLVSYFNPYEWRKLARDGLATYRESEAFTCLNTYWFLLSSFAWQGYVRAPRSLGGRLISGFWWIFVIFSLVHYIAGLTNYIRASQTPNMVAPVSSFRDVAMTNHGRIIVIKGGSTVEYFKTSKHPVNQRIWNLIDSRGYQASSVADGIDMIRRNGNGYVFIMESLTARHLAGRIPCDLMRTSPSETPYFQAFGLPKSSKYREAINVALLDLRHRGALDQLAERWLVNNECPNSLVPRGRRKDARFGVIELSTFIGPLVLLAIGIVAGCILTVIEICVFKVAEKEDEATASGETPSDGAAKKESDV